MKRNHPNSTSARHSGKAADSPVDLGRIPHTTVDSTVSMLWRFAPARRKLKAVRTSPVEATRRRAALVPGPGYWPCSSQRHRCAGARRRRRCCGAARCVCRWGAGNVRGLDERRTCEPWDIWGPGFTRVLERVPGLRPRSGYIGLLSVQRTIGTLRIGLLQRFWTWTTQAVLDLVTQQQAEASLWQEVRQPCRSIDFMYIYICKSLLQQKFWFGGNCCKVIGHRLVENEGTWNDLFVLNSQLLCGTFPARHPVS